MKTSIGQIMQALNRHDRIALQLSGGRDSIAVLYMLRLFLNRITVYWVNTGAAMPETVALMDKLRQWIPNFVEIAGDQPGHIERFGYPSDIVPASATPVGRLVASIEARAPAIQDRYTCCINVMMLPMQKRMMADGITLIIRGQKNADKLKGPSRSGMREYGAELLFPLEHWSSREVMEYLKAEGAPIPRFYEMLDSAPDCLTCSAYWEEGHAAYLKRYHHPQYLEVQRRLDTINQAVAVHIGAFNQEVNS
jgi:phosphoadenosine phosphosulfate reductase